MGYLIASRAVAGIGGTGLLTVASVITTDLIPLRERGHYQGLMMLVFGAGASLGGPVSGWIADTWGWSYAFYVQVSDPLRCLEGVLS
jgi:MFS family permease